MVHPFRRTSRRQVGLQLFVVGVVGVVLVLVLSAVDVISSASVRTTLLSVTSGPALAGAVTLLLSGVLDRPKP